MKKTRPMLRWAGFMVVCAIIAFYGVQAWGEKGLTATPGRPDQITINTLADFDRLEMPPVTYFHDKHTDALAKENKGCDTCHYVEDNAFSFAYLRRRDTRPEEIKNIYHSSCIGCHNDMIAAGKQSGPQDGFCRSCHNAEPPVNLARLDAGMDKVLHFRHLDSKNIAPAGKDMNNCSACHHQFDEAGQRLVYVKGQENSCRYCHLDQAQDGVISLQEASHQQCLNCHLTLARKGVDKPMPLSCRECHGAAAQMELAKKNKGIVAGLKGQEIPRLQRGQPDATLVMYNPQKAPGKSDKLVTMPPVPFNHAAHEKYNDSCRVCHHAAMDSCSSCHTLGGATEGGFVTFEQAMHRRTSQQSCIGCHAATQQARADCAGCHNSISQAQTPDLASCQQCHTPITGVVSSPQQKAAMAASLLENRRAAGTFPMNDIPDKVVIKGLSDQYKPVEMKHRKHVLDLMKGMENSHLAAHFHADPGTMCQGCHHNSPASKTPPACVSCHPKTQGVAAGAMEPSRPGLQAAYHGQCMSCHRDMGVKPAATSCNECHQPKQQKAALVR